MLLNTNAHGEATAIPQQELSTRSMPPCSFFLASTCMYGGNYRNSHDVSTMAATPSFPNPPPTSFKATPSPAVSLDYKRVNIDETSTLAIKPKGRLRLTHMLWCRAKNCSQYRVLFSSICGDQARFLLLKQIHQIINSY